MTDTFIQGWNEQISNLSRANTYKLIANFNFKCYLDVLTVRKFRYAFTRLHVASHHLETEAGRWHKPNRTPVEERKYPFRRNTLEQNVNYIKIYVRNILKGTYQNSLNFYSRKIRKL